MFCTKAVFKTKSFVENGGLNHVKRMTIIKLYPYQSKPHQADLPPSILLFIHYTIMSNCKPNIDVISNNLLMENEIIK